MNAREYTIFSPQYLNTNIELSGYREIHKEIPLVYKTIFIETLMIAKQNSIANKKNFFLL